jgi:membrane-associated protease RseP (regulator of RpoE activity)
VEYSLRAIPLGGFVGFPDDDPESEFKPDDPDLLRNRSIPGRFLVMSAGIIANCIFAFSILFVQVPSADLLSSSASKIANHLLTFWILRV